MEFKEDTLSQIASKGGVIHQQQSLVGFDGFVDKIMDAVKQRNGNAENYTRIDTISEFGGRISAAAGKSTNIELFQKMEKLGGNGPIMANSLVALGMKCRYIGLLGKPVHPVFEAFAKKTDAVSVGQPGITQAVEFDDGKIMFGDMGATLNMTFESIIEAMGEGALFDAVSRAQLFAMVNWTMLPHSTEIYTALLDKVLPNLPQTDRREFFFDFADPEKRSDGDLRAVLSTIGRFSNQGYVTLGLNLKEALHVHKLLGLGKGDVDAEGLKCLVSNIRNKLGIECVVVHPTDGAACATREDAWYIKGPYCEKPKITTGAGDHFNAGFCTAQRLGMPPQVCLTVGVCNSGSYVRTAKSPSLQEIDTFIRNWE